MAHAKSLIPLKDQTIQSETSRRGGAGSITLEALVVLFMGVVFALVANHISPRGLQLTRNYFPVGTRRPAARLAMDSSAREVANAPVPDLAERLAARLKQEGLQLIDGDTAVRLFHDPRFQQGRIVFIDARDELHYQEGHIPGAGEFDPYRPEKYFPAALPACRVAEQIVVYCHGGDCDDSESAALTLRDVGIPLPKLFIYGGGISEWTTHHLPVEIGGQNSGKLRHPDP